MSQLQRQRRRRARGNPVKRVLVSVLLILFLGICGGTAGAVAWVIHAADQAPNLDQLKSRVPGQLSEVFASDGTLLGYISNGIIRQPLLEHQQPKLLRDATVAVEDRRFYQHGGVDYYGIVRAAVRDIFDGSSGVQGGSTLTMQLVGNVYLQDDRSNHNLKYKIEQAKLANELEDRHTKDWILTQYLNDVPYGAVGGQQAIGVGAAARMFFGKTVGQLDLPQIALLAGLPQAPTNYNPFLNPSLARYRRGIVLAAMQQAGYITTAEQRAANAAPLEVRADTNFNAVKQPYVFDYIRQQLVAKLGQKTVDAGGLRVYTTLNLKDQANAQAALQANEGFSGDPDASLTSIDPSNGHILAMAQNSTYGVGPGQTTLNYSTSALRQSGSSFKPFVMMAMIHDDDGDPNSTYYTSKFLPEGWLPGYPSYSVHTSEESYQGNINIQRAMADSDNTVFAQLGVDVGTQNFLNTAYAMGITTKQEPNPADAIGGLNPGVTTLQMSDAYATLANGGSHYDSTIFDHIDLPGGKVVPGTDQHPDRVFSDGEAYAGTQVLKTVITEAGATGTAAGYGCPAAGKTGTTSNYTDAWFVGYTPNLSTAVWVGYNNEAESMTDVNGLGAGFGGTLSAPIWRAYMKATEGSYCADFPQPTTPWHGIPYKGAHATSGPANTVTGPYTITNGTTTALSTTTPTTATTPTTPVTTPTTPKVTTPAPTGTPTAPTGGGGIP